MAEVTTRELQRKVGEFLEPRPQPLLTDSVRQSAVEVLNRTVHKGWRTYLVGGFLRNVVVHPHSYWPRDFDVVVEGCSSEELSEAFMDILSGHNRFGGLTLRRRTEALGKDNVATHELDFDIWRLEDTWALRHFELPHTIQSFVQTPFLNIDSIAISIGPGKDYLAVFEHGFFEALKKRFVEINKTDNPYPVLCAVRGLIMAATLNFVVGPKLATFIYELAASVALEEFLTAQIEHYHHLRSSRVQLEQWILDVRTQLEAGQEHVRLTTNGVERTIFETEKTGYLNG